MQQHPLPLPLLLTLLLLTITLLPLPSLCTPPSSANFPSRLPLPRDRLFCAGPLPPGTYGGTLPAQAIRYKLASLACGDKAPWSAANFTDLADLCTVGGNPEGNMGGMCAPDGIFDGRRAVFDPGLALATLLYDDALLRYCMEHCFCPATEDRYLAADLWAARPLGRSESGGGEETIMGVGRRVREGVVSAVGRGSRLRAYRGRGWQCMGVQGRGTSGLMSCYCRGGTGAVTFFLGA
ncbi:hypothetical protein MMC34_004415 [Xylographa carneopallida]|nr:hypothetical protein [Xylographa carneopallida]